MIPLCWVNLPFGQNHPTYLKFVVSMYFAITSKMFGEPGPCGPEPARLRQFCNCLFGFNLNFYRLGGRGDGWTEN
jgi:hypothetical protein